MAERRLVWRCAECGTIYRSHVEASRAMREGCAAGCSGIDVDLVPR